jgi:hypothetical protein
MAPASQRPCATAFPLLLGPSGPKPLAGASGPGAVCLWGAVVQRRDIDRKIVQAVKASEQIKTDIDSAIASLDKRL